MTMPDTDTIDDFGGALANYAPVVDPTTDRDGPSMDVALEDVAQMTHTAVRAWVRLVLDSAAPVLANPNGSDAGWGNSVPPTPTRTGTGVFKLTWPATVTDALGVVHDVDFVYATAAIEGATFGFVQARVSNANEVTINVADHTGAVADLSGTTIVVLVR
jgi:hypothetical protein